MMTALERFYRRDLVGKRRLGQRGASYGSSASSGSSNVSGSLAGMGS